MKYFNTLVRILLYRHKDIAATQEKAAESGCFYNVPHIPQLHLNLCTDASMNMLYKIGKKPISSMSQNPREVFKGMDYQKLPASDFGFRKKIFSLNIRVNRP